MTQETAFTPDTLIRLIARSPRLTAFERAHEDDADRIAVRARGPYGEIWHTFTFKDGMLDDGAATHDRARRLLDGLISRVADA